MKNCCPNIYYFCVCVCGLIPIKFDKSCKIFLQLLLPEWLSWAIDLHKYSCHQSLFCQLLWHASSETFLSSCNAIECKFPKLISTKWICSLIWLESIQPFWISQELDKIWQSLRGNLTSYVLLRSGYSFGSKREFVFIITPYLQFGVKTAYHPGLSQWFLTFPKVKNHHLQGSSIL